MGGRRSGRLKCWHCGGVGHAQTECTALLADGGGKRCFRCGSSEHVVTSCPLRDPAVEDHQHDNAPWPRIKRVVTASSVSTEACIQATMDARMSVLITTSPVPSNPSTMMLEAVLGSFSRVEGLVECPLVIVCDGYRYSQKSTWKAGRVTDDAALRYEKYLENLEALLESGNLPRSTQLVILEGRNGQALAVKAGLIHVNTPLVCVHQHDLEFMFDFKLRRVLDVIESPENDVKYIGMPLLVNLHYEACAWQHHGVRVQQTAIGGLQLVPVIFWYDSTHITSVAHYHNLIFTESEVFKPGDFVEETFGVRQRLDIMAKGLAAHPKYGTYHCLSFGADGSRRPLICHLNGVRFLTPEQRAERGFPADPPKEFFPSRVMVNRRQRKVKRILDEVIGFAATERLLCEEVRNILSKLLNETRISISAPASRSLVELAQSRCLDNETVCTG
mmetsp:Transcript_126282/g.252294  ORF Transcript_126282/g.252294 Transcript_126282/m.252294 type:complete len:446 (-) Transcript_126282:39-1376(-)